MNVHRHHALTDLVPADPRINQESRLLFWPRFEEEDGNFVVPDLDGYLAWLDEKAAAGEARPNTLVLIPPATSTVSMSTPAGSWTSTEPN